MVAPWVYATPLAYAAYVEHSLGRRIVVTAEPANELEDERRWLRDRSVLAVTDQAEPAFLPADLFARRITNVPPYVYVLRARHALDRALSS